MVKFLRLPLLLGLSHGLNDLISGYLLATYAGSHTSEGDIFMAYFVYSMLAFGGQLPAGWLLDARPHLKPAVVSALGLLALGLGLTGLSYAFAAIVAVGIASALLHVAGGAWVWRLAPRQSGLSGIFLAPGVIGLAIGGLLGGHGVADVPLYALAALALLLAGIAWSSSREQAPLHVAPPVAARFDGHDAIMLLLLAAICLRSMLWNILNLAYAGNDTALLLIALSAFSGKFMGGFLADLLGWKRFLRLTLPVATILLAFFADKLPALCIGIGLLQSATPLTLRLMHDALPKSPATAVGLCVGMAIALSGLPMYLPHFDAYSLACFPFLCGIILLYGWWITRKASPIKG